MNVKARLPTGGQGVSSESRKTDPQSTVPGRAAPLALPATLRRQLDDFRATVRRVKGLEANCIALFGVLVAWLALFLFDRLTDTSVLARFGLYAGAIAACGVFPVAFYRWIWGTRGLDQLARLIARRFPSLGDQLLGVVELVGNTGEQARSRVLCEAAIGQVAEVAGRHDLRAALPRPRHRLWLALVSVPLVCAGVLGLVVPAAAANAWQRFLAPWRFVERYTFARIDRLPETVVIPHGEPAELVVRLDGATAWRPARAKARIGGGGVVSAERDGEAYALALAPQVSPASLRLAVGDARQEVRIQPTFRPEITALSALVQLPDYLGIEAPITQGLRGGGLSVVKGSRVAVTATANRELASASIDGSDVVPQSATIVAPERLVEEAVDLAFAWEDRLGLSGGKPLTVSLVARDDEPPTITVDGLGGKGVLLDSETVRFMIQSRDDFGVKQVGLEWVGSDEGGSRGEQILASGAPEADTLEAVGTFAPANLGIAPQTIQVRAFVEDYLPGRERIRSAPTTFVVMNSADHALWINDQIGRWRQQAAEVRDRELELLARNEQLEAMSAEELDAPESRKTIREQAAAERNNGRRLGRLAEAGGALVREAMRNPEFEAGTLEELAGHVKAMEEMAAARMPGVGELLQAAADAPKGNDHGEGKAAGQGSARPSQPGTLGQPSDAKGEPSSQEPPQRVGEDRGQGGKPAAGGSKDPSLLPPAPQVVDGEGSAPRDREEAPSDSAAGGGGEGALGLPTTTVGSFPGGKGQGGKSAQQPLLAAAVEKQRQLIADFAAIARQLADVMARLEGTTFVKRLKAASRNELKVGQGLSAVVAGAFGRPRGLAKDETAVKKVETATRGNDQVGERMSVLMDDLDAYAERRPQPAIRTVIEEMKELDVLGSLRQLSSEIPQETGLSIARSEFWSDTFDRWADELVPPPKDSQGPGKSPPAENLPPEIVLEAMQILEAETNLREETRVAQQRRAGLGSDAFKTRADGLAETQAKLARRVGGMIDKLADMPDGPVRFDEAIERMERELLPAADKPPRFDREIRLFQAVEAVMDEAQGILASPETGRRAIAAETEAIELLLQSQFGGGGGGGGGGGNSPGGGGSGSTTDSALARLGAGINARARLEAPEEDQAVGKSGRVLPEEFRDGLDAYFNAFERGRQSPRSTP
jgi:hypothetical protein